MLNFPNASLAVNTVTLKIQEFFEKLAVGLSLRVTVYRDMFGDNEGMYCWIGRAGGSRHKSDFKLLWQVVYRYIYIILTLLKITAESCENQLLNHIVHSRT